jgi:hypothetical protein
MRAVALALALIPPLPVTTVDAIANIDGSVTIFWSLPPDPSVVGVTVFRDRLDFPEPVVEFTLGRDDSLTDFSTGIGGSYRYRVHTRNAFGELSVGVFVEVFVPAQPVVFVEDDDPDAWFVCWASAAPGLSLWPAGLAAVLIFSLEVLRRGRWSRRLRNRSP